MRGLSITCLLLISSRRPVNGLSWISNDPQDKISERSQHIPSYIFTRLIPKSGLFGTGSISILPRETFMTYFSHARNGKSMHHSY